jgi:hypothetical protein
MCCYLRKRQTPNAKRQVPDFGVRTSAFALLLDDRGVAAIEGILVFALLAGVLLGCMLLGQWGTHLQNSQMGARLLAFNAGDANLAKFGRAGDTATQTFSTGVWDTLTTGLPTNWLNTMFTTLTDDYYAGRVKGTQRGRLPSQGRSLFDFTRASVSYFSNSSAASNAWSGTAASAKSTFDAIAFCVGHDRVNPWSLGSKPTIPATNAVLETIYTRVGVR